MNKGIQADDAMKMGRPLNEGTITKIDLSNVVRLPVKAKPQTTTVPRHPLTDSGNTERFAARHQTDVRYVVDDGRFRVFDGVRWIEDLGETRVGAFTKDVVRLIALEAAGEDNDETRTKILRHALTSEKAERRRAMLSLVKCEPGMAVTANVFDADPWLLNVQNGTVDLRTGALTAHRAADLHSKIAAVSYDASATAPRFTAFIEEIIPDAETRAMLQRFLGSALTGIVRDHAFVIAHGSGANGKSVLFETIKRVMGDGYAGAIPTEMLTARKFDAHPAERMTLRGKRFCTAAEIDADKHLNEALVKQLTGGDAIMARGMGQDFTEFRPTHKIVLSTNYKPRVRGTDNGIWRRLRLVPFDVVIPKDRQDPALADKLMAEGAGILRWLVEGCLAWQRDGLGTSAAIEAATAEFRTDEDQVGRFLEERCEADSGARVAKAALFAAFEGWCKREGLTAGEARPFYDAISKRPGIYDHAKVHGGAKAFRGLRLIDLSGDPGDPENGRYRGSNTQEFPTEIPVTTVTTVTGGRAAGPETDRDRAGLTGTVSAANHNREAA